MDQSHPSGKPNFPLLVYIQHFDPGKYPVESAVAVRELEKRGLPYIGKSTEDLRDEPFSLTRNDLVIGDTDWTRRSMKSLRMQMPEAPDYPKCLEHLLHRKIEITTLGKVQKQLEEDPSKEIFIKPAKDTKAFNGLVEPKDQMLWYVLEEFGPSYPVVASEIVNFVTEYRVYCIKGEIVGVSYYCGLKEHTLDLDIVKEAVKVHFEHEKLDGCVLDFGVVLKKDADGNEVSQTTLIEVNDGYSIGFYEGVPEDKYVDMLIARWAQLVR